MHAVTSGGHVCTSTELNQWYACMIRMRTCALATSNCNTGTLPFDGRLDGLWVFFVSLCSLVVPGIRTFLRVALTRGDSNDSKHVYYW